MVLGTAASVGYSVDAPQEPKDADATTNTYDFPLHPVSFVRGDTLVEPSLVRSILLTATRGKPRSRTLASTPCSATWSTISPDSMASPFSRLVICSPSNQSDQSPSRCPFTRIS